MMIDPKSLNSNFGLDTSLPTIANSSTLQAPIDASLAKVSASAGNGKHVLLISVDGLREADLTDPKLQGSLTNIRSLATGGVTYTNAYTSVPSDSFPGELSYLTGAGPATTGVYYDDSYSRTLKAPGATSATPFGTEVQYAENIDKDPTLLNGGGGIDPTKLPVDAQGNPVYPHSFLQVNTIFNVAHDAGLVTAFADKHPAYEIANGPSGNGVSDLYTPEINASVAIENGKLVDASTAQDPSKLTFATTTTSVKLTEANDDLKVQAIINEISGLNSLGTQASGVPSLFGLNFQAVSVGEKLTTGGIAADGTVSATLKDGLSHTDASIGQIVSALKTAGLYDSTEIVLTAKHGQNPRIGAASLIKDDIYTNALDAAGITVAQATQDDVALLWLDNQAQTTSAAQVLNDLKAANPNSGIDTVLFGAGLQQAGFGNPTQESTTPDIIVKLKPRYVLVGNPAKPSKQAEHGGFSEDDTHVALIVGGGAVNPELSGSVQTDRVSTKQIAVTALKTLGLNPADLQGAVAEKTQALPGLNSLLEDGKGGQKTFAIYQGDTAVINNFGGVGQGTVPTSGTISEADTLKFFGNGLIAKNMILAPQGNDLVITFEGVSDTKVTLQNFKLENLDNLSRATGAAVDLYNIVFDGQKQGTDSFDVFNNDAPRDVLFNRNTVTYLDAISRIVTGFNDSKDIINAPVGDHTVFAGSGNDMLRGGVGFNTFFGGDGNDTLEGGKGETTMVGGKGNDTFVIGSDEGLITIADFKLGKDKIALAGDLTFEQLNIAQGTGSNETDALIRESKTGKLLAVVKDIQASLLTVAFAPYRTIAGPETATTPQGWFLTPAGKQVQLVDPTSGVYADRPYNVVSSPDGKTLVVSNNGQSTQSLMVIDRASGHIVQTIPYEGNEALYIGLTFSPDGKQLYASAGGNNKIRVYDVNGQTFTEDAAIPIPLPQSPNGKPVNLYAGGLTISANGKTLYVADNLGDSMTVIDLPTREVTATVPVGHNPYTVVLSNDGKTAYVSNWGEESVSVIDLSVPTLAQGPAISVGTHPNAMALNPTNNELYVANADSDNVSVIDTRTKQVIRTIDLSPYPGAKEGSSPNALTVSPDGKLLYVANATNNDVAVVQLGDATTLDRVKGLIPTAWYPTGVVLSPDGKELDVINAKGLGAGPNPNGAIPYRNPEQAPNQYVGSMIQGTLSQIDVSNPDMLQQYTQQVIKNNGFDEGNKVRVAGIPQENVIPLRPGDPSPIKHVIYVIKENRTFDQVLGSLGQGNGDPSLNLFGDESAPNQRQLAQQFVTLDNFYADAEVSADGWNWSTGALANTYVQKNWPANYADGNRNRPYDFEGGNLATSPGKDPQDAFIWNKLSDAGIDYRNYGFRVFGGQVATTEPRLATNTDLNFAGFDLTKPDSSPELFATPQNPNPATRIDEWLKEFNQYETNGTLPTVEFVRLPSDHTAGTRIGAPTPRAYMADNDLALGKLVDAVSHSADWKDTAIFVLEDDAQDGPDHVDAHRTITQVISPYTQTGKVDSTFYSTVSMLRTMELIVGLGPMSQYDAAATPMLNSFTNQPDFTPYTAIKPTQNLAEKNPVGSPLGDKSVDWSVEDQNEAIENLMIWKSVKGADSAMPTPITRFRELDAQGTTTATTNG